MTDFSKLLNPEQCSAATAGDGPLLVLAAAGTGKTRTLVHRVAYLIEQGIPPGRIHLLTFTHRAAKEMLERAEKVVGDAASEIWSGTFHSVCARLLRRYGAFLGYGPGFQILDEDDQKKLVGEIIKTTVKSPKDFPKKEIVAKMISEAANESRPVGDIAARWQTKAAGFTPGEIEAVAAAYEARKRELGAMDFDDLLVKGLELLKTQERVRDLLQEHFLHILVDEYQDTNGLQAELTDILAARHRNIMAVGDDFQCIYTWRGARIENILDFPQRWHGCRIVKLERNYRSVPGVLDVANVVMQDAPSQFEKTLRPTRGGDGELPWLYRVYDGRSQAHEILRLIDEARSLGYRYSDIAVLYRSHYQSIDVQMALARNRVPHRITSGVGVFEQVHTKDVLAYLRLLVNPADELSFMRLASLLPGVGESSAKKLWDRLGRRFDAASAESRAALGEMLGKKAKPLWPALSKCFECAGEHIDDDEIGEVVEDFCDLFYEDHLRDEWGDQDAEDRLEDVKELAAQIAGAEPASGGYGETADASEGRRRLEGFLADVALMTNLDVRRNDPGADRVTLSTVHQAKGMEWPVVFIPWCSEGMFPAAKAAEEGRVDEERRLFYVAVTRAKDRLFMFTPETRKMPDGGMYPLERSTFVKELPPELVNARRVASYPDPFDRGYGGGGYGRGRSAAQQWKTSWRR
ncbi:MAG: ATP-dependent helicase [Kiritimatiellae bacterium]|nr:ATP-dependent helicase [Kiritimatiellia bacterium]